MIHKLVLSMVAVVGFTTLAEGAGDAAPAASVSKAAQGGQSTSVSVAGSWSNCGNGITLVRVGIKYQPKAGGNQLTKFYDLPAPPAILGTGNWAFTTAPGDFNVGDTVTATFIWIYKGPPATTPSTANNGTVGQNLVIE